jgi:2-methylisocitrate lyase-like PEP mutase family enzyme
MRKIADAIVLPLNVLIWKGLAPAAALKDAGVRRISAGAGISRAAYGASRRAIAEILDAGRYDAMFADAENCPNLNALMEG